MTRELEFCSALATLASLPPGTDERPCNHCRVMTREECLVEADVRLWPMEELCEECDAMLRSDLDGEYLSERELRQREAALRMGGGGWLNED